VVKDCVLLLLNEDGEGQTDGPEVDTSGIQSLFEQMMDPGFDWPVNVSDSWPSVTYDWEVDGTSAV
jgi:hypothetical protein